MREIQMNIDGKVIKASAEKIGTTLWVHLNGRTFTYEPPKKVRKSDKGGVAGDVAAPMPGKINKVSVAVGDTVQAGQCVLFSRNEYASSS